MKRIYKQVAYEELEDLNILDFDPEDFQYDGEYITFIYEELDGTPIALIGHDGGEPEDQTLYRNWSWVCGALNDAYNQGRKDAGQSTVSQ